MNINEIDNIIQFSDVLKTHEMISKIFHGWKIAEETNSIKRSDILSLWAYRENYNKFLAFDDDSYVFDQMKLDEYHYKFRIYENDASLLLISRPKSYQILIGYHDNCYVFFDANEDIVIYVSKKYLNDYLKMFVKTTHSLFDESLIEYKKKIINIEERNIDFFKVKHL